MKFETVRIHFLRDVLVCCHPKILLPWQRLLLSIHQHHLIKSFSSAVFFSFAEMKDYITAFTLTTYL